MKTNKIIILFLLMEIFIVLGSIYAVKPEQALLFIVAHMLYEDSYDRNWANGELGRMRGEDYFTNRQEVDFCNAIERGDTGKMKKLLEEGLDINAVGKDESMTFLIWSYIKQNKESYQYLLENGANPNIYFIDIGLFGNGDDKMKFKYSMMDFAVKNTNDNDYLKLALEHGGDPNATECYFDGNVIQSVMIIFKAISSGSLEYVQMLVEAGATVNVGVHGNLKYTPLLSAIDDGRYDIVYYLLEKGDKPGLLDKPLIIKSIKQDLDGTFPTRDGQNFKDYRDKVIKLLEKDGINFGQTN